MAKEQAEHGQKIKLLKLFELLKQESDEAHPMTTADICKRMEESGIPCDRRTLSQDIDLLNQNGYKVICERHGNKNIYYVQEHNFSLPELKILMDAVHAANFIPEEKAKNLIIKILLYIVEFAPAWGLRKSLFAIIKCAFAERFIYL